MFRFGNSSIILNHILLGFAKTFRQHLIHPFIRLFKSFETVNASGTDSLALTQSVNSMQPAIRFLP